MRTPSYLSLFGVIEDLYVGGDDAAHINAILGACGAVVEETVSCPLVEPIGGDDKGNLTLGGLDDMPHRTVDLSPPRTSLNRASLGMG